MICFNVDRLFNKAPGLKLQTTYPAGVSCAGQVSSNRLNAPSSQAFTIKPADKNFIHYDML